MKASTLPRARKPRAGRASTSVSSSSAKGERDVDTGLDITTDLPITSLGKNARFMECYQDLLNQGFDEKASLVGAWAATGRTAHGRYSTSGFARMLGINRRTISRYLKRGEPLALAVAELRADYWADRVSDVDEAIYQKARTGDISAARLFYQRANVMNPENDSRDEWSAMIYGVLDEIEANIAMQNGQSTTNGLTATNGTLTPSE